MSDPSYLREPLQFIDPARLALGTLILVRLLAPLLWVLALQGIGLWLIPRTSRPAPSDVPEQSLAQGLAQVMAGAVVTVLPFHLAEWLRVPIHPNWAYLWLGLGIVGWMAHGITRKQMPGRFSLESSRILGTAAAVWLIIAAIEARTALPAFGDPLAFLVHAKQFLRSGFVLDSLDPRQQLYPDLLIHQMAFFSAVFRQDPTASLMALAPLSVGGLVLVWLLLCSPWIRELVGEFGSGARPRRSLAIGIGIALFALTAARNPLRYGLVAGRYPYLLGCLGLLALIVQVSRWREVDPDEPISRIALPAGFTLAFVFLSHSGLVPLMLLPGLFLAKRSRIAACGAAALSLLLVTPRLLSMVPLMRAVPEGPEAQTFTWSQTGGILRSLASALKALWDAVAVSPICQMAFLLSLAALVAWRIGRLSPKTKTPRSLRSLDSLILGFLIWAWFAGSGLFETLGFRGSLSHYGQRGYGLIVALVTAAGLMKLAIWVRAQNAARFKLLGWVASLALVLHLVAYGRMLWRERSEPPSRLEAFQVLQRFSSLRWNDEQLGGLVPAATLNGVIPFALTYGDVEYFPYFFPERRMLVSFVAIPGFYRSIPDHVALYGEWLTHPTQPEVLARLRALGMDTVWLPAVAQFEPTLKKLEADPAHYQPWFAQGRERVFRLIDRE